MGWVTDRSSRQILMSSTFEGVIKPMLIIYVKHDMALQTERYFWQVSASEWKTAVSDKIIKFRILGPLDRKLDGREAFWNAKPMTEEPSLTVWNSFSIGSNFKGEPPWTSKLHCVPLAISLSSQPFHRETTHLSNCAIGSWELRKLDTHFWDGPRSLKI